MVTSYKYLLNSNSFKVLIKIRINNFCNWKLIKNELKGCNFTRFTVKRVKFNHLISKDFFKTNLTKNENSSLKLKFNHSQIINEVSFSIKNINFKKNICFSLTSSDISNFIKNKILYKDDRLRNGNQFLNESQTMVIEFGILNGSNTETNLKCLDIMNLIEKENSQHIIEDLVDNTVILYKNYMINHISSCHNKICYECFNISKSPDGKFLIEVFKTNVFFY